jgi:transcriptional regulator with XRE-family HTH domain
MKERKSSPKSPIPGSRIYEARLAKGLSQEALGVLIGLDEGTASARISRYESGIHEPPINTARNIAKTLGIQEDDSSRELSWKVFGLVSFAGFTYVTYLLLTLNR